MTIHPAPKSPPRPKRPRKAVKRVNKSRKAKEFARTYHSVERVEFVKREPCLSCYARPSVNAHVGKKGKGAGRKADYDQITSLCDDCHKAMHSGELVVDRGTLAGWCAHTQAQWLQYAEAAGRRSPHPETF